MKYLGELVLCALLGITQLVLGVVIILIFTAAIASILMHPVIVVFLLLCLLMLFGAFLYDEYDKWRMKRNV